jgi:hypothetical protein
MNGVKGETPTTSTAPDDPLQPPVCIGCGYELTGLAPDCNCPECGMQRDPRVTILRGYATGRRYTALTGRVDRHLKWWNWIGAVVFASTVLYFAIYHGRGSMTFFIVPSIQLVVVTVLIVVAYNRQKTEGQMPVHAIIHPDGVCQRSKFAKPFTLIKMDYSLEAKFDVTKDGFRTLKITRTDILTFYANMAKYQPVAIEFKASDKTVARVRAMLNGEKS